MRYNWQIPTNSVKARELWTKACAEHVASGCIELAAAERDGWGAAPNWKHALALYDQACFENSGAACAWAQYERARGNLDVAPDVAAREALSAGCADGHGDALVCWLRLRLITQKQIVASSGETIDQLAKSACIGDFESGEFRPACVERAAAVIGGETKGGDRDWARKVLGDECDRGSVDACAWLGVALYAAKDASVADQQRGAKHCAEACARGSEEGCVRWGTLQITGVGTTKDVAGGLATLDRSCSLGIRRGCLAVLKLIDVKLVSDDGAKSLEYREKACKLGPCN